MDITIFINSEIWTQSVLEYITTQNTSILSIVSKLEYLVFNL